LGGEAIDASLVQRERNRPLDLLAGWRQEDRKPRMMPMKDVQDMCGGELIHDREEISDGPSVLLCTNAQGCRQVGEPGLQIDQSTSHLPIREGGSELSSHEGHASSSSGAEDRHDLGSSIARKRTRLPADRTLPGQLRALLRPGEDTERPDLDRFSKNRHSHLL